MTDRNQPSPPAIRGLLDRRRFVQGFAATGAAASMGLAAPRARAAVAESTVLRGTVFDLVIAETPVNITGRNATATAVNGQVPGPTLIWRQGDTVTLNVTNRLRETTSIHWHGINPPAAMDGVPGVSFAGIAPGATFTYRIPVKQSGTYWYHSHSGLQEPTGLYGPLILTPQRPDPFGYDREHVVLLSDWSDGNPDTILSNLKFDSDYYNHNQRTAGTFISDVSKGGLGATVADRWAWGGMRMSPTDLADVTGGLYTYLANGRSPASNWTALFRPGERVRLRFVNGASMTFFDVRIPGLRMTVVAADGNNVSPVAVDEFRIGPAETYDVIVEPGSAPAYTIFAQAQDRTGFARATLAVQDGASAAVPAMDPRPIRTMADMGMAGSAGGNMAGMAMGASPTPPPVEGGVAGMAVGAPPKQPPMTGMAMGASATPPPVKRGMAGMAMGASATPPSVEGGMAGMAMGASATPPSVEGGMAGAAMDAPAKQPPDGKAMGDMNSGAGHAPRMGVGVDNVAMQPADRLGDPGVGLGDAGRRVLNYRDLRALVPVKDNRPPSREILLHLTGNMDRYMWGFDGKKYSEAPEPIRLSYGERTRFVLVNDTMMEHPIHLHGMYMQLENGQGAFSPLKHTVIVKGGERLSYIVTADALGAWAFHCHLFFHMDTGMLRVVSVA